MLRSRGILFIRRSVKDTDIGEYGVVKKSASGQGGLVSVT